MQNPRLGRGVPFSRGSKRSKGFRSSSLVGFPVFRGADPFCVAEALGEVAGGGEAQNRGDLGQGMIRLRQEPFALPDPAGDQVIDGGDPIFPLEGMGHVIFIDAVLFR